MLFNKDMSDDKKVIDLFSKKASENDVRNKQRFFKGFQYVKLSRDENGNYFVEKSLREYAKKCFYVVSVMKHNSIGVSLYKYKVPYDDLLNFFNEFRRNKSYGEIIDIERHIPDNLA